MKDASGKEVSVNKYRDIKGVRCGLLVAQLPHERRGEAAYHWMWNCDCGGTIILQHGSAKITGHCGCLREERFGRRNVKHGMHKSGTYYTWATMKARCTNEKATEYSSYGGRGITVCERWMNSFEDFLSDMGVRPEGKTLDRWPDMNGNYEPGNCRWATKKEQQRNRRDNRMIAIDGVTRCLKEWCEIYNVPYSTARHRLKIGLAVGVIFTMPPKRTRQRKEMQECQA
jgi:hypothetical protein